MIETKYTVANFETVANQDTVTMPKKQYDIDILNFLRSLSLKTFTVTDVTRYLLEAHTEMFDKKKNATQFVYRHLKLLEKQGVIKTHATNSSKAIIFSWSSKSEDTSEEQMLLQSKSNNHHSIVKKLQEKIRLYKAEMLTNVGEAEAYSEWAAEMPELAENVKSHYQHTRDEAKLMLGKVKGFERLLAEYEAHL